MYDKREKGEIGIRTPQPEDKVAKSINDAIKRQGGAESSCYGGRKDTNTVGELTTPKSTCKD